MEYKNDNRIRIVPGMPSQRPIHTSSNWCSSASVVMVNRISEPNIIRKGNTSLRMSDDFITVLYAYKVRSPLGVEIHKITLEKRFAGT